MCVATRLFNMPRSELITPLTAAISCPLESAAGGTA
jgi:hypothetical protein